MCSERQRESMGVWVIEMKIAREAKIRTCAQRTNETKRNETKGDQDEVGTR